MAFQEEGNLVTSSTLNNWQGDWEINGYVGNPIHVDLIEVVFEFIFIRN